MNYETKYFKYKQKYLDLKQSIMTGGAFPFNKKSRNFSIMVKIGEPTLGRINERRVGIGLAPIEDLHMTFLSFYVNLEHPESKKILDNPGLNNYIVDMFKKHIIGKNVVLNSLDPLTGRGRWEFLGRNDDKYLARVYEFDPTTEEYIRDFRHSIFNKLNELFSDVSSDFLKLKGSSEIMGKDEDLDKFKLYKTKDDKPLYAILEKHWLGVTKWKPHISIFNKKEFILTPDKKLLKQAITIINEESKSVEDKIREIGGLIKPCPELMIRAMNILGQKISDETKIKELRILIGNVKAISTLEAKSSKRRRRKDFLSLRITHNGIDGIAEYPKLVQNDYAL